MKTFGAFLVAVALQLAESDRCCYGTHGSTCSDCASPHNWCSASAARCEDCSGVLCNESSIEDSHETAGNVSHEESEYDREKREQDAEQAREREEQKREQEHEQEERRREEAEQKAEHDREAAEKANETEFAKTHSCCYKAGCSQCEHVGDYCSTSAARCTDCGGSLCLQSEIAAPSSGPSDSGGEGPWESEAQDNGDNNRGNDESHRANHSDVNDAIALLGEAPAQQAVNSPFAALGVAGAVVLMLSSALVWQRRTRTSAAQVPLLSEEGAANSQA